MTVQIEDGYTRIAHELIEALCRTNIPGSCMQCFMVIMRKTYGFHRKDAQIPFSEFSEMTEISRRNVIRSVQRLVEMNMIGSVNPDTSKPATYSINKNYKQWDTKQGVRLFASVNPDTSCQVVSTRTPEECQPGHLSSVNPDTPQPIIKDNFKDNFKDISCATPPKKSVKSKTDIQPDDGELNEINLDLYSFVNEYQHNIRCKFGQQAPVVTPAMLYKGALVLEEIIDAHGYSLDEIKAALEWGIKDRFWQKHIRAIPQINNTNPGGNGLSKIQNLIEAHRATQEDGIENLQRMRDEWKKAMGK